MRFCKVLCRLLGVSSTSGFLLRCYWPGHLTLGHHLPCFIAFSGFFSCSELIWFFRNVLHYRGLACGSDRGCCRSVVLFFGRYWCYWRVQPALPGSGTSIE